MILILILKQWLKYLQISKPKSYKNFTENAANVNTKKIMKTFMWPTVRRTWAEEKRIRLDIMSFEAKEIDVNLKKIFYPRKNDGSDYEPDSLEVISASLDVPSIEARDILQNFETSLSRYFSQTPLNNMRYSLNKP